MFEWILLDMKHEIETREPEKIIHAACPICGHVVPLIEVYVIRPRLFGAIKVRIEGDGTDWVAHMWSHNGR